MEIEIMFSKKFKNSYNPVCHSLILKMPIIL